MQFSKLKPLGNRVVVRRVKSEETTPGGIIIPTTAQEKSTIVEVLAVGPGRLLEDGSRAPMGCKVGDQVLIGKYAGSEHAAAGDDPILVVTDDDVLLVFEKE